MRRRLHSPLLKTLSMRKTDTPGVLSGVKGPSTMVALLFCTSVSTILLLLLPAGEGPILRMYCSSPVSSTLVLFATASGPCS